MSALQHSDPQVDPLDAADFDAVAFLNAKFPTGELFWYFGIVALVFCYLLCDDPKLLSEVF